MIGLGIEWRQDSPTRVEIEHVREGSELASECRWHFGALVWHRRGGWHLVMDGTDGRAISCDDLERLIVFARTLTQPAR